MTDIFADAREALAWGEEHIQRLNEGIAAYVANHNSYTIVTQTDGNGVQKRYNIKFNPVPTRLANIASDAVNNLRMALDRTGYATAVAAGKRNPHNTHFPFPQRDSDFENPRALRRCEDVPHEIMALFRTFKPYKGGNDTLWALNWIANTNKHRLLHPVGVEAFDFSIFGVGMGPVSPKTSVLWDGAKREIECMIDMSQGDPKERIGASFSIAFDEPDIVRRQPIIGVLRAMAAEVKRIIDATADVTLNHSQTQK